MIKVIFITKQDTKTKFKPDLIGLLPILTHTHTQRKIRQNLGNYLFLPQSHTINQ